MPSRITIARIGAGALLAAAGFAFMTRQADASLNFTSQLSLNFAMVGVTPDQVARLTVVNAGECREPRGFPPGPCRVQVELSFFDAQGNVLVTRTSEIPGGGSAVLDLDANAHFPPVNTVDALVQRAEVRASVHVLGGATDSLLLPAVDVFSSSGPDAGKSQMSLTFNHNATFLRDGE